MKQHPLRSCTRWKADQLATLRNAPGHHITAQPLEGWAQPGAVFTYRGNPEKILAVSAAKVETVGAHCFYEWHAPSFLALVADGQIFHTPRATQHTKPPKTPAPTIRGELDPAAQELFARVYEAFGLAEPASQRMAAWLRSIRAGEPAEPWEHMLGVLLIEIGAEHRGLGHGIATRQGRGRPPARQAEAAATQDLIKRFINYLEGGEAVSVLDWQWLKALLETGLRCVGLLAPLDVGGPGRPMATNSPARVLAERTRGGLVPKAKGAVIQAVREAGRRCWCQERRILPTFTCHSPHSTTPSRPASAICGNTSAVRVWMTFIEKTLQTSVMKTTRRRCRPAGPWRRALSPTVLTMRDGRHAPLSPVASRSSK